jgi:outer membrane protein assembly factor BamB
VVTCAEAESGSIHWQERVGGNFFSSPVCADNKVYGVSTAGEVIVLQASKQFKVLGRAQLGEKTHATPAIAHGRIYFRTLTQIHAVGPL